MLFACKLVHAGHNANMWWVGLDRQRDAYAASEPRWPRAYMRFWPLARRPTKSPADGLPRGEVGARWQGGLSAPTCQMRSTFNLISVVSFVM